MPPGGEAPMNKKNLSGGAEPRLTSGGEAVIQDELILLQ